MVTAPQEMMMRPSELEWAADVLSSGDDIVMPVRSLWLDMQNRGMGRGLSLDSFATMLESDERFEFLEGPEDDEDGEEVSLLEELGFEGGPHVKLASRELTADYVTRMLRRSTENMLAALEGAWEMRPDDDPEAEQQLLEVMTLAQRLKSEVEDALRQNAGLLAAEDGGGAGAGAKSARDNPGD
jgi:hypothetical protein